MNFGDPEETSVSGYPQDNSSTVASSLANNIRSSGASLNQLRLNSTTIQNEDHSRTDSKSESIFTLMKHKLMFWKEPSDGKIRVVVPNHMFSGVSEDQTHKNPNSDYSGNRISTTRYNLLTFIPKNLFEQFRRLANLYFIGIVVLNWIPVISAFGKEISMLPLFIVFGVTAIKDLVDDRRRYNSDKSINNFTCQVWDPKINGYKSCLWKALHVGDVVRLKRDDNIPADILVLKTSDPSGLCYIQTMNLDGESNLKQREVVRGLKDIMHSPDDVNKFQSKMELDPPIADIYKFSGKMVHPNPNKMEVDLAKENLLLRGCCLKNTEFVVGIVIYAGGETKAMLNNKGPRHKRTGLERLMNLEVYWCVVILAILCFAGATGSGLWHYTFSDMPVPFIPPGSEDSVISPFSKACLSFLTFIIVLQVMIPLSLYVTIELTKLMQIYHISNDNDLFDEETDKGIACRATNISEDLGQIEYVFSDKTGTLTENEMLFRRCTVDAIDYKHSDTARIEDLLRQNSDKAEKMREFLLILALCNTVVVANRLQPDNNNNAEGELLGIENPPGGNPSMSGAPNIPIRCNDDSQSQNTLDTLTPSSEAKPIFEAESPDELALVDAAFEYNCRLIKRTPQSVTVAMPGGEPINYEILQTLPFDSDRKRMSIILRHPFTNQIILYCKGADSAIFERLRTSDDPKSNDIINRTKTKIDDYAKESLRTLVMAKRVLSKTEYDTWLETFHKAKMDLSLIAEDRDKLVWETYKDMEANLELVGATGVEDRLQDEVPQTIEALRTAGIIVWVLTGDKQETAKNIAKSCNLFSTDMHILTLNESKTSVKKAILSHIKQIDNCEHNPRQSEAARTGVKKEWALVVDGDTLTGIWEHKPDLISKFLTLAKKCSSVLCCRATPLQKALVVKSVKKLGVWTLAIGDGANDVSMIQSADVGIGISGKEGMQAVMASDLAIPKFKYLKRLLLVHGHWCYDRLARMILYFFYKNAAFVFVIFWYQILNGWSGSVMIDQMYLMVFNLFFTALPPMAIGIYDQDCPSELLEKRPELYRQGRLRKVHRAHSFWLNMLDALYQSIVIFFMSYGAYHGSDVGMFEFGTTVVVACMFTMLLHMVIEAKSWTIIHGLSIVVSILLFYGFAFVYNTVCINCLEFENPYWVIHELISSPVHWLVVSVTTVLAVLPRFICRCLQNSLFPSDVTKALLSRRMPWICFRRGQSIAISEPQPSNYPHKPSVATAT